MFKGIWRLVTGAPNSGVTAANGIESTTVGVRLALAEASMIDAMEARALMAFAATSGALQNRDPVLESKIGGTAFWPAGQAWPRSPTGEPMRFLAQINLAQLPWDDYDPTADGAEAAPAARLNGLVRTGMIQYFLGDTPDGLVDAPQEGSVKVCYHSVDRLSETVSETQPASPDNFDLFPLILPAGSSYGLSFACQRSLPVSGEDIEELLAPILDQHGLADEDGRYELFDTANEKLTLSNEFQLGGYAHFIQWDPRSASADWPFVLGLFGELYDGESADPEKLLMKWGDAGDAQFFAKSAEAVAQPDLVTLFDWASH